MNKITKQFSLIVYPIIFSLIFLGAPIPSFAQTQPENITITTYYPSPSNYLDELHAKKATIGDNYFSMHWGAGAGEIATDADLVVEENVGIGTFRPMVKLDVHGNILVNDSYMFREVANDSGLMHLGDGNIGLRTDGRDNLIMDNVGNITIPNGDINLSNHSLVWGNKGILQADQGGSIELQGLNRTPYIDFTRGNPRVVDFNARLILSPEGNFAFNFRDNINRDRGSKIETGVFYIPIVMRRTMNPQSLFPNDPLWNLLQTLINPFGINIFDLTGAGYFWFVEQRAREITGFKVIINANNWWVWGIDTSSQAFMVIRQEPDRNPPRCYQVIYPQFPIEWGHKGGPGSVGFWGGIEVPGLSTSLIPQWAGANVPGTSVTGAMTNWDILNLIATAAAGQNGALGLLGLIGLRSDVRLKKNIVNLDERTVLKKLKNLRGVTFDWKAEEYSKMNLPKGKQVGLIAQELEKEFPSLVATDTDGYKIVDYARLTSVLLQAIKGQQAEIDNLKSEINNLKIHR